MRSSLVFQVSSAREMLYTYDTLIMLQSTKEKEAIKIQKGEKISVHIDSLNSVKLFLLLYAFPASFERQFLRG